MDELLKAALAGAVAAAGGDRAPGVRRRTGHPGGHPSPARRHLRGWLAGHGDCRLRHRFPSLPGQAGGTKRLRRVAGADRPCHRGHRHRHRAGERRRVDRGRHPGGGWPLQPDAQGFGAGRVGLLRPGCQPCTLVRGCGCTWSAPCTARPVAVAPTGARPPTARCSWTCRPSSHTWSPSGQGSSCWWPTSTTTAARSRASWQSRACGRCDRRARANPNGLACRCSSRRGSRSSRSTTPSRATRPGAPRRSHARGRVGSGLGAHPGLTAAIWHHHQTGQATLRSLVAHDH